MKPMNYTDPQKALLASIDMANNGYIPCRYLTRTERQTAEELDCMGVVKFTGDFLKSGHGQVSRRATVIENFPLPASWSDAPNEGFDYEGAILSRQAWYQV